MLLNRFSEAYLNSPPLWKGSLDGIEQFSLSAKNCKKLEDPYPIDKFGYYIEKIVKNIFETDTETKLIINNLQVNSAERTLGEIDFIVQKGMEVIYIENAFKFYLFDPTLTESTLSPWIGPNRSDSLLRKLNHIKTGQFPLLQKPETIQLLQAHGLKPENIKQCVLFKGLLFEPHGNPITPKPLNKEAVVGSYFHFRGLAQFKTSKFYIQRLKINWILQPETAVNWMTTEQLKREIETDIKNENSVFVWRKDAKGHLFRHFITWW